MRYGFRCTQCALEFDVSRPVSEAATPAACPVDGARAERVFTMPNTSFNRPAPAAPKAAPGAGGYSHSGHTHGAGARPHSH